MEQRFSWQAPTELEISFGNTYNFSPQFSDTRGLWTSTSCSNLLSDEDLHNTRGESSDTEFIYTSPEKQLYSFENVEEPLCSDYQLNDVVASLWAKKTPQQGEPCTDSFLQPKQTKSMISGGKSGGEEVLRSVMYGNRNSAFVEWNGSPRLPPLQPQKSQFLHKRCIRFLKCINDHRISPLHDIHGGGRRVNHDYDKLSIHHVVAERKRREQMKQMFSALRGLLLINPKKGKAPVLLETINYVAHLKQRVEQLERRNRELEELLHEKSHHY